MMSFYTNNQLQHATVPTSNDATVQRILRFDDWHAVATALYRAVYGEIIIAFVTQ